MTCGIYKLVFEGTDKVYIGQSVNIEKRYTQHLTDYRNNRSAEKLLFAFDSYGIPKLVIEHICSIEELDDLEIRTISKYNSVLNGFNFYSSPYEFICKRGTEAGGSKYSKDLILDCLMYLSISGKTKSDAELEFGIKVATLDNILGQIQHHWIMEHYSELLTKVKHQVREAVRASKININKVGLSVKGKGIKYPKVVSPEGKTYIVDNINEFAQIHSSISKSSLHRLLSGQTRKTKGWTVCQEEQA
jgi:hypothetical protein